MNALNMYNQDLKPSWSITFFPGWCSTKVQNVQAYVLEVWEICDHVNYVKACEILRDIQGEIWEIGDLYIKAWYK